MTKKSPDAFRTISEVAAWLNVPTHVLRFWESRFSQVKPVKRAGGRRYYRPADMELLGGIRKLLHEDGMTIRGVQKLLREEGIKHVAALSPALTDPEDMKDITPSNVVNLKPDDSKSAPEPEVEDAEPVAAQTEVAAQAPETAVETSPESPVETPVEMPAETLPPQAPPEDTPAPQMSAGDEAADATEDTAAEDLLDTPEGMDFLAHDADVAPPEPPTAPTGEPPSGQAPEPQPEAPDTTEITKTTDTTATPKPAIPDISHIPDDPADDDVESTPVGPAHMVLTHLRTAQHTGGLNPANRGELRALADRLTALKGRMGKERRSHSAE